MGLATIEPHSQNEHTEIHKIPKLAVNQASFDWDTFKGKECVTRCLHERLFLSTPQKPFENLFRTKWTLPEANKRDYDLHYFSLCVIANPVGVRHPDTSNRNIWIRFPQGKKTSNFQPINEYTIENWQ